MPIGRHGCELRDGQAIPVAFPLPSLPSDIKYSARLTSHPLTREFVSEDELKLHLKFLAVLDKHHQKIAGGHPADPESLLPAPDAFLSIARSRQRFDLWILRVVCSKFRDSALPLQVKEIPPLDVLMVLHAYMLSPWDFYEDSNRIYPELKNMRFPLEAMMTIIDNGRCEYVPTKEQKAYWETATGTDFDLSLTVDPSDTVAVSCPRCSKSVVIPWVDKEGHGMGQYAFEHTCGSCALSISRDTLSTGRFLSDLALPDGYLAHTVLNLKGEVDFAAATKYKMQMRAVLGNPSSAGGDTFDWKLASIQNRLRAGFQDDETLKRVDHIIKAYSHPYQTCIDLSAAVYGKVWHIHDLHIIGWYGDVFLEGEKTLLPAAIIRYRYFLALYPLSISPAPDIDLVFHTHQLKGATFRKDTVDATGQFVKHEDGHVGRSAGSEGIEQSENIWQERYGTAYLPDGMIIRKACNEHDHDHDHNHGHHGHQ